MANTKISQLPSYTGTAADLRWFVMNNSGETETFKYSGYTSPYRWNNSTSGTTDVNYTKSSQFNRLGGTNTETADSYSNFIVGKGNTVGNSSKFFAIFGNDNTATGGAGVGTEVGSLIFGQNNSHIGGTGAGVFIMGAFNSASGNWCGALGTNVSVSGYYSFGGGSNVSVSSQGSFSWGDSNNLSGGNYQYSFGEDNDIATSSNSGIFGGKGNRITGSGNRNAIIGSSASTINNRNDVVMLGCSGRTATTDSATFVENLVVFNYAALDFANDTAAAAGGVVLGQIYHNNGALRIRIV